MVVTLTPSHWEGLERGLPHRPKVDKLRARKYEKGNGADKCISFRITILVRLGRKDPKLIGTRGKWV